MYACNQCSFTAKRGCFLRATHTTIAITSRRTAALTPEMMAITRMDGDDDESVAVALLLLPPGCVPDMRKLTGVLDTRPISFC